MKVIDDGVIKYDRSNFTQSRPIDSIEYRDLEYWRKKLFLLNLIGEYEEEQVGFGNMSQIFDYSHFSHSPVPQFVITGSQTGKYAELDGRHYTRVLNYNIDHLKIWTMGAIEASSEALTHAAIYAHNKNIKAIFHIHSEKIWQGMIDDKTDSTAKTIPYGTVEMARATEKCVGKKDSGSFTMLGHTDGVIIYGKNLAEVGELTLKLYEKYIALK